jgi:hypothetical protein
LPLDRDAAVTEVLSRPGAPSGNAAGIRGEVELLIARANIVVDSCSGSSWPRI